MPSHEKKGSDLAAGTCRGTPEAQSRVVCRSAARLPWGRGEPSGAAELAPLLRPVRSAEGGLLGRRGPPPRVSLPGLPAPCAPALPAAAQGQSWAEAGVAN